MPMMKLFENAIEMSIFERHTIVSKSVGQMQWIRQ